MVEGKGEGMAKPNQRDFFVSSCLSSFPSIQVDVTGYDCKSQEKLFGKKYPNVFTMGCHEERL
jgi:hypothetical protein